MKRRRAIRKAACQWRGCPGNACWPGSVPILCDPHWRAMPQEMKTELARAISETMSARAASHEATWRVIDRMREYARAQTS